MALYCITGDWRKSLRNFACIDFSAYYGNTDDDRVLTEAYEFNGKSKLIAVVNFD